MSLRSEFRVVMSVTISAYKRCSGSSLPPVVLYEGACLIYLICVCLRKVLPNTYCVLFFALLVYVLLPISLDCPFFILSLRCSLKFIVAINNDIFIIFLIVYNSEIL